MVHFEKARQLVQEEALGGAEFESQIRDLYMQLGQVYELSDQHEQASALYTELERVISKRS